MAGLVLLADVGLDLDDASDLGLATGCLTNEAGAEELDGRLEGWSGQDRAVEGRQVDGAENSGAMSLGTIGAINPKTAGRTVSR